MKITFNSKPEYRAMHISTFHTPATVAHYYGGELNISIHNVTDAELADAVLVLTGEFARRQEAAGVCPEHGIPYVDTGKSSEGRTHAEWHAAAADAASAERCEVTVYWFDKALGHTTPGPCGQALPCSDGWHATAPVAEGERNA